MPSAAKLSAYSSNASGALRKASSTSSPPDVQPGRSGNQTPTAWPGPVILDDGDVMCHANLNRASILRPYNGTNQAFPSPS